jgi:hypothetical protein
MLVILRSYDFFCNVKTNAIIMKLDVDFFPILFIHEDEGVDYFYLSIACIMHIMHCVLFIILLIISIESLPFQINFALLDIIHGWILTSSYDNFFYFNRNNYDKTEK